ncbi:MAG: CE1759 family FMN reductase [Actinomycetaceae bacterium]|nr:NAD(P)H-dependent oxidoreductase [Actinomycetaceae bacterium]MDY6083221.1 CE1759 family FMN reductase [Actinomycetaceae bacterium]
MENVDNPLSPTNGSVPEQDDTRSEPASSKPAGVVGDLAETDPFTPVMRHITLISAGMSESSQSTALGSDLLNASESALAEYGVVPEHHIFYLRDLANDILNATVADHKTPALEEAINQVIAADAVITVTPTYKGSYSGLFKMFWDLIEDGSVTNIPVLLGATGGTPRHSLMIDYVMRPLFSYLRMDVLPHAVFAATDDWGEVPEATASSRDTPIAERVARAGSELATVLMRRTARDRDAALHEDMKIIPFEELLHTI